VAVLLSSALPAGAQTIVGSPRDRTTIGDAAGNGLAIQDTASMRAGFSTSSPNPTTGGGRAPVFVFLLPNAVAPGTVFTGADLDLFLISQVVPGGISYNLDLYGLGTRPASGAGTPVTSGDYFAGPLDATDATLIQDNFVTTATPVGGFVPLSATGSANLLAYINTVLTGGAAANTQLLFRVNPDVVFDSDPGGFEFQSGDASSPAANRPFLTLSTTPTSQVIPEPGTISLLTLAVVGAGTWGGLRRRRRGTT
jgi:hypothetical protein